MQKFLKQIDNGKEKADPNADLGSNEDSASSSSHKCSQSGGEDEGRSLHALKHQRQLEEAQAREKERQWNSIDMDVGISNAMFQPSKLLARKKQLIDQLEESKYNHEKENLDQHSLRYMLERLEGQQGYEIAMIRELDPYFNFQTKIFPTLTGISQGKDSRVKIQEQKIKNLKQ